MQIHIVALGPLDITCCVPVEVEAMATSPFVHHPFVTACPQNFFLLTPQHPPNAPRIIVLFLHGILPAVLCHAHPESKPDNHRVGRCSPDEGNMEGPAGKGCANKTHGPWEDPEVGAGGVDVVSTHHGRKKMRRGRNARETESPGGFPGAPVLDWTQARRRRLLGWLVRMVTYRVLR
ncbi:hypothetical protein F5148DRAFT_1147693 [Russula earlei]|uniref:Uncharacterized protein n=1 Tax=Russula earlei TaxID=71964 RepID=A0ACC0UGN1_9AGAM|nr:hypothetical protein F5148DRAFT_1147693 [Russula earlei]